MRLAVVASHPVQYYAPLFRQLAGQVDLRVFYAHRATPEQQARAGFDVAFDWDVDLTSGYEHTFLTNVSRHPGTDHFLGCDTPGISRSLREGRFDVVMVLGWHLKCYLQAMLAAKAIRVPVMVRGDSQLATPRTALKRIIKAFAYPPFLSLFTAALYVGQRSRAYYRRYKYPDERLFFSPHCVDTDWFSARATIAARAKLRAKAGIAHDAKVLLFAGKLVPFKRPLDVIAAAERCRAGGMQVEVMVAGSGALGEAMTTAARQARVPFHDLGFLNQTQMPAAYAAADILILPSDQNETWGLVANEAIACKRPVIVSDACGCALDLCADRSTGRAFPSGDVTALARAVDELVRSPPAIEAFRWKARAFSLERASFGIEQAARSCLERSSMPSLEKGRMT